MTAIEPWAILPPREQIAATIESQRAIVAQYLKLACEFYDRDLRPMIVDGETVQRIGPDPVPDALRDVLGTEQAHLAELHAQLHEATLRECVDRR